MQEGNFKNTIVLKDIKSNLIEEAIIVLKENKEAWSLNKIENSKTEKKALKPIKKDYIVKEAELIISNYIEDIDKKEKEKDIENRNLKYKRLKKYAFFTTIMLLIQFFVNILN